MLPVAVLGGFILLIAKQIGIVTLDEELLSALTYHGIAPGFYGGHSFGLALVYLLILDLLIFKTGRRGGA